MRFGVGAFSVVFLYCVSLLSPGKEAAPAPPTRGKTPPRARVWKLLTPLRPGGARQRRRAARPTCGVAMPTYEDATPGTVEGAARDWPMVKVLPTICPINGRHATGLANGKSTGGTGGVRLEQSATDPTGALAVDQWQAPTDDGGTGAARHADASTAAPGPRC